MRVTRRDTALLRRSLLNLTALHKILAALIVLAALLAWWPAMGALRAFGNDLDYSGLQALGPQTVALLQEYNPAFWWAMTVLVTLFIVYVLYGLITAMQRRVRHKIVRGATVAFLAHELSDAGREVLDWAWRDRREPITVGVLQQALLECSRGRAGKIALAREHAAALAPQPDAPAEKPLARSPEM